MTKPTILIPFFVFWSAFCTAQVSGEIDGIKLHIIGNECPEYYYGEPFWIYLEAVNITNEMKNYCELDPGVNCKRTLRSVSTGVSIKDIFWDTEMAGRAREYYQEKIEGFNEKFYQAKEKHYYSIPMQRNFGSVLLSDKRILSGTSLTDNLYAIPVGSYELIIQYFMYPTDKVLTLKYPFKIIPLPLNEEPALKGFVKATIYGMESDLWGTKNYDENTLASFENFLSKYPNSVFAQYALVDMVTQVYAYPVAPDSVRKKKFQQYYNNFGKIKSTTLKFQYGLWLSKWLLHKNDYDTVKTKNELDKFLIKNSNDYITSYIVIDMAKRHQKISGLKNYAKEKRE